MLKYVIPVTVLAMLAFTPMSQAKTPDEEPPAVEEGCDDLQGVLYGLCVAYCEAMDCGHPDQAASDEACERVLANFQEHSSDPDALPPCEETPEPPDS
jgi:hypothetical protein